MRLFYLYSRTNMMKKIGIQTKLSHANSDIKRPIFVNYLEMCI
jgi:hypothetical protein